MIIGDESVFDHAQSRTVAGLEILTACGHTGNQNQREHN